MIARRMLAGYSSAFTTQQRSGPRAAQSIRARKPDGTTIAGSLMRTDFDVVILGSGLSGLAAAVAATHLGLKPIVIEKAAKLGGGTVDSYGILWVGQNHLAEQAGIADDLRKTRDYVHFLAGGEASDAKLNAFVNRSPAALKFFQTCGVPFRLVKDFPDHYYGLAPGAVREGRSLEVELISGADLGPWQDKVRRPERQIYHLTFEDQVALGGMNSLTDVRDQLEARKTRDMRGKGIGLISHFVKLLLQREVPILTKTATRELIMAKTGIAGIVTRSGTRIKARHGVILATGGYESNPTLVEAFERMPGWVSPSPRELDGDGLRLGIEAGGFTQVIRNNLVSFLGLAVPQSNGKARFHPAYLEELCSPHTIVVNRSGARFGDETNFQMLVPKLKLFSAQTHAYENLPAFLIFDRQYAENFSCAGSPKGAPIPDWIARSPTIEGLAAKLGVDEAGLVTTVDRFNGFARSGQDRDFHRGELAFRFSTKKDPTLRVASVGTIEQAPFYGVELCTSGFSSAGLLTDVNSRVLDHSHQAIAGLYALGNTSAHTEFGVGYQAGFSHTSSLTFGYLAARHLLKRATAR